ncbi:MAG: tetratricopeptide repeat protein [Blastocatellia bacterium]|nr:tetratricopeptide repeat protein [Blastocatellia bacterium]
MPVPPRRRRSAIDESLVDVHASLAFIKLWYDWDDAGALREALRAVALNPNSSEARRSYAHVLWGLGRFAEAVTEGTRARELDPLSLLTSAQEGMYLFAAGRIDNARDRLMKTMEIEPEFWIALLWLAKIDIHQERYDDAIEKLTRAREASHGNSETISLIGYAWAMMGDRAKALGVLAELEAQSAKPLRATVCRCDYPLRPGRRRSSFHRA